MAKIIAAAQHMGGANAIAPVVKRLMNQGGIQVIPIGYGYAQRVFKEWGIEYKDIGDWKQSDVSVHPMKCLLDMEGHPDLVLIGTAVQDEKNLNVIDQTLISAARVSSTKSLAVIDFWGNERERFSDIVSEKLEFLPDKIAALDERQKQTLTEIGIGKNKIAITGNPHFDALAQRAEEFTEEEKQRIREKIRINWEKLVFFAGNVFGLRGFDLGFWDLDVIRYLERAIEDLCVAKVGLVIKLHPSIYEHASENGLGKIENYVEKYQGRLIIVKDISSVDLSLACDLTVVIDSTVGIEAVNLNRPVICLRPNPKLERLDNSIFARTKAVPVVYEKRDISGITRRAITDKQYRQDLITNASALRTDGQATNRVVDLAIQMIKNSPK